jgi:hypothetical protein
MGCTPHFIDLGKALELSGQQILSRHQGGAAFLFPNRWLREVLLCSIVKVETFERNSL